MVTAVTAVERRLFTVDEYHQMAQSGILREDERVELLDGEIFQMSPIGVWHWIAVNRASELLITRLLGKAMVAIQGPVRLDDRSEPVPDVAVFKPRKDFYAGKPGGPTPDDVLLLIEVADSSLAHGQNRKRALYARSGMPDYWIVDLNHETLLVFRDPQAGEYATSLTVHRGGSIAPLAFPDVPIAVDDLIGDPPVSAKFGMP